MDFEAQLEALIEGALDSAEVDAVEIIFALGQAELRMRLAMAQAADDAAEEEAPTEEEAPAE